MIRKSGQNMVEVAILMTVVGVVCIAAYTLLGNNLTQLFQGANNKVSDYNKLSFIGKPGSTPSTPTGTLTTSGQWGGTPSSPITKCVSGSCSIDFGNYILTGVPENLSDTVKSSGSSGANDKIYSLYMQLASQLEAEGKAAEAQDFKDMANLSKYMGSLQKYYEDAAQTCASSADKSTCINTTLNNINLSNTMASIPPELSHILTNVDSFNGTIPWQLSSTNIGQARFDNVAGPMMFNDEKNSIPSAAFVNVFDKIMSSSNLSSSIKGIAKELYLSVSDINQEFKYRAAGAVAPENSLASLPLYDPLTGSFSGMKQIVMQDFFTGQALSTSNTSNALACFSSNISANCHQTMN